MPIPLPKPTSVRYVSLALIVCWNIAWHSIRAQVPDSLSGQVFDAQTRQPLPGVSVAVNEQPVTLSRTNGVIGLSRPALPAVLTFSYVGYQPYSLRVTAATQPLLIYLEPVQVPLNEVVVRGYENNRKLLETAGAVALLNRRDLERFGNTSLVPAVNTLPGVRMEERSPGSYRISIRGSTLRAPYGVRNVKVYWNDIPFTDPGGNTALNLIDFNAVSSIEVIKGPAGSLYGAGTGGVILLQSPQARFGEQRVKIGSIFGSYGLRGVNVVAASGSEKENLVVTYAQQHSDGYREHSAFDRKMLNLRAQFYTTPKRTISINGFYSDLRYQTPLGLTLQQFEQNPRLSRPGAIQQQVYVAQKTFNLGVSQTYQLNEHFSNTSTVYGTFTQFENPFLNNYERTAEQGLGGRTHFTYAGTLGTVKSRFTLGGEYQTNFSATQQYNNRNGQPDTLTFNDEITATQGIVFAQTEFDLPRNYFLTLGGSYNHLQYRIARLTAAPTDPNYSRVRNFDPVFSPRVALLKKLSELLSVYASVSSGFSPPSVDDIRPSDGSINTGLQAEKGVNYELGFRGNALRKRLDFDLTLFSFQLKNTITTYTNPQGIALFRNAGRTSQNGAELRLNFALISQPAGFLTSAKVFGSYTYYDFHFRDYVSDGRDFSGNYLTGAPRNTLAAGVDVETKPGLYANLTTNYVDRTPLNDANTVYAKAYTLLGGRIGYRKVLLRFLEVGAFAGVDNALNQRYSLGNDLNAFGGRYFQPAPGRNYYGGLSVTLKR